MTGYKSIFLNIEYSYLISIFYRLSVHPIESNFLKINELLNNEYLLVAIAKGCDDLYKSGKTTTGVYTIDPDELGVFDVRCDMHTTPGRGWTVFQRRVDGSVDFYQNWIDYKNGFGNLSGEFWLGLDKIHRLSATGYNLLRIDLETFENEKAYAVYKSFSGGNEIKAYILNVGTFSGN